jgi:prepilin-type N-terminal cleavage/methylation domain-containing protein
MNTSWRTNTFRLIVRFKAAFTLIELLVVISLIACLLAVLMPSLGRARSAAMRVRCASNLRQVHFALNMYVDSYEDKFPCAEDPVSTQPFYWLWMGRGWRRFIEPYLNVKVDPNNPSVLVCPRDATAKQKYESTSYSYSMSFYHSPAQIDEMSSVADTYADPRPSMAQVASKVRRPAYKIIFGEWLSNHLPVDGTDGGWWCWKGSRNYLFVDGTVRFAAAENIREANNGYPDANLTRNGIDGSDWPSPGRNEKPD